MGSNPLGVPRGAVVTPGYTTELPIFEKINPLKQLHGVHCLGTAISKIASM